MNIQNEWNKKGEEYAKAVNQMVEFGEKFGWENWKGNDPIDDRNNLAEILLEKLREANKNDAVETFRNNFPPSHAPFIKMLDEKAQYIGDLCVIDKDKVAFMTGTSYQKRKAFILEGYNVKALNDNIISLGKSPQGNCFAVATNESIITYSGWEGEQISKFEHSEIAGLPITQLLPYNDGSQVLLVSSEGIYHLSENGSKLIHPVQDDEDAEWSSYIDMEHAAISQDNKLICVGDQCSNHRILDNLLCEIGNIYPESSYPHFTLFSKDNLQVIMNSCHFYNGITIGVLTENVGDTEENSEKLITIDDECRVYSGVSTNDYYILGDAYGYIRAFDKTGKNLWRHFLGSTISGIAISDDESTLFVGSSSGMLHKIKLGEGSRDTHTISNANHFEEFRILFWKNEEKPLIW